jgi:hypothetical protein
VEAGAREREESSPGPPRFVPLKIDFQAGANVAFSAEASLSAGILFSVRGKLLLGSDLELDIAELRPLELRAEYRHNNLFTFPDKYSNPNYSGTDFSARFSFLLTLQPLFESIKKGIKSFLLTFIGDEKKVEEEIKKIKIEFNADLFRRDFFRHSMRGAPAGGVGVYLGEASATPSVSPEPLRVRPGQEVALKVWVRPEMAGPLEGELRGLLGLGQTYEVYILGYGLPSPQKLGEAYVGAGGEATLRVRVPENLPPGNYLLRAFNIPSVPFFDYASNLLGLEVSGADFTLSLNPASLTLQPGQSGTTTLTITPQNGFTGTVNLSLVDGSGNPVPGITLSPTSVSVTGPSPVTQDLTLSVDSGVAPGTYNLQVRATSGSLTKTANLSLTVSAPGGGGAGTTWTLRTSGTSTFLNDVTYGNGLFVAVGAVGAILTSPDGVTWTQRTPPTDNWLEGVAYGNGTFVAVGAKGTILTSPDGVTWTQQTSGTDNYLFGVTYGNGLFVAVGKWGTILTSPDGVSWTARASGTSNWLRGVTYGNGLFVAVGDGAILTSPDGASWTARASGTGYWLYAVTYGNGLFVAVGPNGAILTSPDGVTWTQRTSGTGYSLHGVTYGNGLFVAAGWNGTILTSPDGVTWTQRTSPTINWLEGVTYGNGTFVAVGARGTILTSP